MPQRQDFNSDEEYDLAMQVYAMPSNRQAMESIPNTVTAPETLMPGPKMTSVELPNPNTMMQQTQAIPGYQGASIVDFLKSMGVDSSKANRKKLAALSGDDNYDMSGSDNQALMDYVKKNAQGKDKIRNSNGDIVSLDGAGQVPLTIKGLDNLNRTGSVSGKKQKVDNFLRQGTPEYDARAMELFGNKSSTPAYDSTDPFTLGRGLTSNNSTESGDNYGGAIGFGIGAGITGYGLFGKDFDPTKYYNMANQHTASSIATATNNMMKQNDLADLTNQLNKNNLNARQLKDLKNLDAMEIPQVSTATSNNIQRLNSMKNNLDANEIEALSKTSAGKALLLKLKNSPALKNIGKEGAGMLKGAGNYLRDLKGLKGFKF